MAPHLVHTCALILTTRTQYGRSRLNNPMGTACLLPG